MEKLLGIYCRQNFIKEDDMKGNSHAKGLSTHRHIFAYCVKKRYPHVKLWQIAVLFGQTRSAVSYGVNNIASLLLPFEGNSAKPPDIKMVEERVNSLLAVCKGYKRTDLILPKKG